MTLRGLLNQNALGAVKEAEIHYDFDSPTWLRFITAESYEPGLGNAFGLGANMHSRMASIATVLMTYVPGTHSLDQALALFGPPAAVTGFFRAHRQLSTDYPDSPENDDTFTIILQYGDTQDGLLVTVKTSIVSVVDRQLKFYIRGDQGSYIKVSR